MARFTNLEGFEMGWGQAIAMGVSTLLSASGERQAGKAQSAQYEYQARQAEADAQAEREYGITQAQKIRKAGARQLAETRASYPDTSMRSHIFVIATTSFTSRAS